MEKVKDKYIHRRLEIEIALCDIFGNAYNGEWWKQKCDLLLGNFYPRIANCYYRIKVDSLEVEDRGNGKQRPPKQFVELVETLLKQHFAQISVDK